MLAVGVRPEAVWAPAPTEAVAAVAVAAPATRARRVMGGWLGDFMGLLVLHALGQGLRRARSLENGADRHKFRSSDADWSKRPCLPVLRVADVLHPVHR